MNPDIYRKNQIDEGKKEYRPILNKKKGFAERSIKQLIWFEFDSSTQLVVLLESTSTPYYE